MKRCTNCSRFPFCEKMIMPSQEACKNFIKRSATCEKVIVAEVPNNKMDRKKYQKERYETLKKKGICVKCGFEEAEPNSIYCLDCREKERKRSRKYAKKNKEKMKEKQKEDHKKRYYERKAKGICTKCGKRKVYEKSTIYCMECYLKDKKRYKSQSRTPGIAMSERPGYGLCYKCGKSKEREDINLCNGCHEKQSKVMKKINENPTQAMLDARELYAKNQRDFNKILFTEMKQR